MRPLAFLERQEFSCVVGFAKRPDLWVISALFFMASTPLDFERSGFVYLAKIVAMGAILCYAVLVRGARTGSLAVLPLIFILVLILNSAVITWSDRAILAAGSIAVCTLLGQARGPRWDSDFKVIVNAYLVIHVVGLLVSLLVLIKTGNVLDLHGLIFPQDSRSEIINILFARLSGFHTEPGTYSQWTLMALLLLALVTGRLFSRWHAIVALSTILTFSLWGLLGFIVFFLAFLIEAMAINGMKRKISMFTGLFIFVALVVSIYALISSETVYSAITFLERKASLTTVSGEHKVRALEFFIREFWNVFLYGEPLSPGFCPNCISPQDAGFALNSIYYFGFVFFIIFVVLMSLQLTKKWSFVYILPLAMMLSWKAQFYDPFLWVIIGYVFRGPIGWYQQPNGSMGAKNSPILLDDNTVVPGSPK